MAQPYIGEIRMFAGSFNPNGWAFCEGQLMPISENEALFQLIGTTYGGDGEETFGLPDLRGRLPMHFGTGPDGTTYQMGEAAGQEEVTLTIQQIPVHNHALIGTNNNGAQATASANVLASSTITTPYTTTETPSKPMAANCLQQVGGSQPHNNFQPYLCVNFIISLFGLYPQPS